MGAVAAPGRGVTGSCLASTEEAEGDVVTRSDESLRLGGVPYRVSFTGQVGGLCQKGLTEVTRASVEGVGALIALS